MSRDEMLKSFTWNAAYAAHAEKDLGSLEVGKLADLVVLDQNVMTVEPKEILDDTWRATRSSAARWCMRSAKKLSARRRRGGGPRVGSCRRAAGTPAAAGPGSWSSSSSIRCGSTISTATRRSVDRGLKRLRDEGAIFEHGVLSVPEHRHVRRARDDRHRSVPVDARHHHERVVAARVGRGACRAPTIRPS